MALLLTNSCEKKRLKKPKKTSRTSKHWRIHDDSLQEDSRFIPQEHKLNIFIYLFEFTSLGVAGACVLNSASNDRRHILSHIMETVCPNMDRKHT